MESVERWISFLDVKPSAFVHVVTESDQVPETPEMIDEYAEQGKFPKLIQLWPAIIVAIAFSLCRYALQKVVFKPLISKILHLDVLDLPRNSVLDKAFKKNHRPSSTEIKELSTQTSLSVDEVNKEFMKRRRSKVQNKKYTKFVEAAWRFIFYTVFTVLGIYTLFVPQPVPWVLDSREHWANWPLQQIYPMVKIYYIVELGAYIHQLAWTEINRSDSWEMIAHHLITMVLILTSHVVNFVRVGVSVLLIHDISDIFLESAKCFNYISKVKGKKWASTVCDVLFAIFALSFFVLRLMIYPYWIFYKSYVDATERFGQNWWGFHIYYWLLLSLQALHVFWFYLISRMIYRLLTTGIEKDERSDDDCEEDEDQSNSSKDSKAIAQKKSAKKTQ